MKWTSPYNPDEMSSVDRYLMDQNSEGFLLTYDGGYTYHVNSYFSGGYFLFNSQSSFLNQARLYLTDSSSKVMYDTRLEEIINGRNSFLNKFPNSIKQKVLANPSEYLSKYQISMIIEKSSEKSSFDESTLNKVYSSRSRSIFSTGLEEFNQNITPSFFESPDELNLEQELLQSQVIEKNNYIIQKIKSRIPFNLS
jgi:hypothetical protein